MPATTTNYSFPTPLPDDADDVPTDMADLAAAIDAKIKELMDARDLARKGETRLYTITNRTWSGNNYQQLNLTFTRTYATAPLVVAYPTNAPGGSSTLRAEVTTVGTSNYVIRVWNSSSSSVTLAGDLELRIDVVPRPL